MYLKADIEAKDSPSAIRNLRAHGIDAVNLDVFSDEPMEFPTGLLDRPSHMSLLVVSGAIVSFLLIVGFVYFTQHSYPLVTGGMPIFSFWSTGVVFYEITMLGAILTTFACFLWESGLLSASKAIPVPTVAPGTVCIRVQCAPELAQTIRETLIHSGALNVQELMESR